MKMYFEILLSFLKIGIFAFGGGSAAAPLIHNEAVEGKKWITEKEFIDIVAITNSLPGPSMVEMATAVGYKQKGWLGGLIAAIAISFPMTLLFVLVMMFINQNFDPALISLLTAPILCVVAALLLSLSKKFFMASKKELSLKLIVPIILLSFVLLQFLGVHPSIIIISMIVIVLFSNVVLRKLKKEGTSND